MGGCTIYLKPLMVNCPVESVLSDLAFYDIFLSYILNSDARFTKYDLKSLIAK